MPKTIIIGAGIVGLLASIRAAEKGHDVVLLEADRPGAGASTANAGVLHLIQPPPGRLRRRLAPLGAREWRRLASRLGLSLYETRLIIPATSTLQSLALPLLGTAIRRLTGGMAQPRIVDGRAALELEPLLTRRVRRALVVEGYGVVDPREAVRVLTEVAGRLGVELVMGARASRIVCGERGVEVHTSKGVYEADYLINAAGAGAARLAAQVGVRLDVRLVEGVMEVYREPRTENIIAHFPSRVRAETKGGAVIPWPWEGTLYGPTYGTQDGSVAERYLDLVEGEPKGLVERIRGFRTLAPDRDFHVIVAPGCGRSVHLLGIESPGFTAAPILARMALEKLGDPR